MHTLKGIFLSLLAVSPMAVSLSVIPVNSANAQANQTLAQCVRELNDAYPYRIEANTHFKHVQICQTNLSTQMPRESLGQCVAGLNQVYPYRTETQTNSRHIEICSTLLQAQQSNSNRQAQPNPSVQTPVLIVPIPGASQPSPQQFATCVNSQMYRQKEVCIDPWGDVDESCFYRGRGGKRTITEPTGVNINQARAICGG